MAEQADENPGEAGPSLPQEEQTMSQAEMQWHRKNLKKARQAGHANLEDAHQIIVAVEGLGRALAGKPAAGLRDVEGYLVRFVEKWDGEDEAEAAEPSSFEGGLRNVRSQRNDYAHEGTAARRLGKMAAKVAIRLEAALRAAEEAKDVLRMRDIMSTPAICAEEWQTLGDIRRLMLLHEFTILPYRHQKKWRVIDASEVVRAISCCGKRQRVGCAVTEGKLKTDKARTAKATCEVDFNRPRTTVIVRGQSEEIVGLVTPFDMF